VSVCYYTWAETLNRIKMSFHLYSFINFNEVSCTLNSWRVIGEKLGTSNNILSVFIIHIVNSTYTICNNVYQSSFFYRDSLSPHFWKISVCTTWLEVQFLCEMHLQYVYVLQKSSQQVSLGSIKLQNSLFVYLLSRVS